MSSYEGLTQLTDHHRLYNFNALHRRSDSVESHGSVSSLSSNHSSVGGRNGGGPPSLGAAETSRFRRVEPPRTLNTGGCSPARNAFHGTPRSSQPHSALLHSTSVMEAPRGQQALNRSRSGSCPMVWAANGSLREHPIDAVKPLHPQSNRWVYSPFAYSPRGQPDRPLCGQVTGSVQYAGGQHDDCRALGGARMPQGSNFLLSNRRFGDGVYDGIEPRDRYPSEQSLADYSQSGRRPRSSATGRATERCPSEQNLSDLAQSPGVVTSSLQRSLSTMSVNVAPNSNFTSKLNCSLSRSFTSRLNDVARKGDEGVRPRKDSNNGRQSVSSPRSPYEMGLCFNVPQTGGRVRKQREVFEREASGSPATKREASPASQKNPPFNGQSQFRHRSFENLSPASKKYSLGSAFGDNRMENQLNSRGDGKRGAKMKAWTPDEDKPSARMNAQAPADVKFKGGANVIASGEFRHNSRVHGYEKRDSLDLTLTPNENRRFETPINRGTRGNQLHGPISREVGNRRPASLLQSMENRPNGPSHSSGSFEGRPSRSLQALNASESWKPKNGPSVSSFPDKLRNVSRNNSLNGPLSVGRGPVFSGLFPGDPEITGSEPSLAQPSTFVSEVYVSIVKPRPGSGLPIERTVSLQPASNSLSLCSPIYDNLLVSQSPIVASASRSSLPLAGVGAGIDGTLGEKAPWASAAAAKSSTRRHSNPTEKVTETSPGVQAHVASQKEQLTSLLNDMKNLHLFRDKLRTNVGQMERDTEEEKRTVADNHFPTAYELERLYEANRQLKIEVQQLSHEIDRHRSRQSRGKMHVEEVDVDSWNCSACTFSNHPALNRCECCDLPKLSFVMR